MVSNQWWSSFSQFYLKLVLICNWPHKVKEALKESKSKPADDIDSQDPDDSVQARLFEHLGYDVHLRYPSRIYYGKNDDLVHHCKRVGQPNIKAGTANYECVHNRGVRFSYKCLFHLKLFEPLLIWHKITDLVAHPSSRCGRRTERTFLQWLANIAKSAVISTVSPPRTCLRGQGQRAFATAPSPSTSGAMKQQKRILDSSLMTSGRWSRMNLQQSIQTGVLPSSKRVRRLPLSHHFQHYFI